MFGWHFDCPLIGAEHKRFGSRRQGESAQGKAPGEGRLSALQRVPSFADLQQAAAFAGAAEGGEKNRRTDAQIDDVQTDGIQQ